MLSWRFPIVVVVAIACLAPAAWPCSRVLWNDSGRNVLVGRNMDWFEDLKSNIWILPRGLKHDGLTKENPLQWTSRYGSIAITAYDVGVVDGLNEKGLGVHALYLPETKTGPRDAAVPGLCLSLWAQYYLDLFATVDEAVAAIKAQPYQLVMAVEPTSGKALTLHLALNDAKGDSAILECINGELKVYHDRSYVVMTNQPTFDKQLELLGKYRGFGGDQRLPGTHEPADRFARGAYYARNLPKPKTDREAIAALMSVMRNVSAPFGVADPERPNVSTTIWRTVTDLSRGVLYYDSVLSPQIFWLDIRKQNFDPDQPVRKLTVVDNFDLQGDVSSLPVPAPLFTPLRPE